MKTTKRIEDIMRYLEAHVDEFEFQRYKSTKGFYGMWIDINTPEVQARVVPIKSYETIVAFVDVDEEVFYEYGKYSASTSRQVSGMYRQFWKSFKHEFVEVDPDFAMLDWGCVI